MIVEKIKCRKYSSEELVRKGSNGSGNPKYNCKDCGYSGLDLLVYLGSGTKRTLCADDIGAFRDYVRSALCYLQYLISLLSCSISSTIMNSFSNS